MTTSATLGRLTGPFRCGPGFLVVGVVQPDVAAAIQVIRHWGVTLRPEQQDRLMLSFETTAEAWWTGWHSTRIRSNGWQPFDQPHPAAYIPLGLSQCVLRDLGSDGLLIRATAPHKLNQLVARQRDALLGSSVEAFTGDLCSLLDRVGVPFGDTAARFFAEPSTRLSAA